LALERLIAPTRPAAFFADHWGKRPLYVPGAADKFRDLYNHADWHRGEYAAELEAAGRDAHGAQRQFRIHPAQIEPLYQSGLTICASVGRHPSIAGFLFALGQELELAGGLPFAKLYASPAEGGFAIHFDQYHVMVAQLSGSKRWRFSPAPVVEAPIASGKLDANGAPVWCDPHDGMPIARDDGQLIDPPDVDKLEEAVLTEGDFLYLPPGSWHVARALGHSLAVSISPPRAPIHGLVARAIEDVLMQRALWRRDVFAPDAEPVHAGKAAPSIAAAFTAAIADLRVTLDAIDQRALHRIWRLNAVVGNAPTGPVVTAVERQDVLEHADRGVRRYLVSPIGDTELICFYGGGSEWSFPIDALTFVEALAQTERFVADEACAWDPKLDWSDVQSILQQLLEAGLLRRAPAV
jgi:hypothetical protein